MAQNSKKGTITGKVFDESTKQPLEGVYVVLHDKSDSSIVTGAATDAKGEFELINVPAGRYYLRFSMISFKDITLPAITINADHPSLELKTIALVPTTVNLNEVVVKADKSVITTSIDRKVYNVDQDMMSKSGSASELLQNVPSVQVDIDGNVSLRGSNPLILINGKSSALMDQNSATVLQQLPANTIERIEVITNPSAKFKPDGTSGIINIVMKKNTSLGYNGNVSGNVGNKTRANGNVRLNYNPGDWNWYATYSIRRDSRNRANTDTRLQTDSASAVTHYREDLVSSSTPISNLVGLGMEYHPNEANSFGISGNYFYNSFTRLDNSDKVIRDSSYTLATVSNRDRVDYEYQNDYGYTVYAEHDFPKEEHKLRLEFNSSGSPEQEDNHFTDLYLYPAGPNQYDNTLIKQSDDKKQLSLDYSNPLTDSSKLEAGYAGEFNNNDLDFHAEAFNTAQGQFVEDSLKTNRFLLDQTIHAFYGTYEQSFGKFGIMGGLRLEQTYRTSNLVSRDSVFTYDHFDLYPTLHLSYKINPTAELQLNYSKRTHRPDGEDLNPFPEYRDPRNISSGNPNLRPEFIHSLEFGCQFQNDNFSVLPGVFYRYTYNRFTPITEQINDSTLLTTRQNLSNDQSAGSELIISANSGDYFTAHLSLNGYYDQIDASDLGYGQTRSTTTWSGSFTCNFNFTRETRLQINSNYSSARLTAQGEFSPSYGVNAGMKQDLADGKFSLILTASDIFATQKRELSLTTPLLNQTTVGTRDARIVYFGFTYHFGIPPKKQKEEQIHIEEGG